jgi:hypothetical protein
LKSSNPLRKLSILKEEIPTILIFEKIFIEK